MPRQPVRVVFGGLRWITRSGAQSRMMPNDLPPWAAFYPQTQRWLKAGVFEALVYSAPAIEASFLMEGQDS